MKSNERGDKMQGKNKGNMDEIYVKYAKQVYAFLYAKTRDADLSDELTQETFYQAVRCINRFDGSCKISTWLCSIAKNQLLEYRRKNKVSDEAIEIGSAQSESSLPNADSAEKEAFDAMGKVEILKTLHLLKEPYREVLYLRIFGNLSFKEIGEIMGKTENWARVTFYRGKELMRKDMSEYER